MFGALWNATRPYRPSRYSALRLQSIKRNFCEPAIQQTEEEQMAMLRKGVAPATGRSMKEVAAEVWGHTRNPAGPGNRSGDKLLRRPLRGPLYASWYPPPLSAYKDNPFKLTDKQMRWREKLKMLRATGKGPPKKGSGKRSK